MAKLKWDSAGERFYETGVSKGVLFPQVDGEYQAGVPWNGLTAVTESPSGAELSDLYADNIKYASLRSAEDFGGTIEAYTYPDEFAQCDGSAEPAAGMTIGQQKRIPFGFSYVTKIGNDLDDEAGYKLHIVYNATVSPTEKNYSTVNDSPDAEALSWEFSTIPVSVDGYRPTALVTLDSLKTSKEKLAALEAILYGGTSQEPTLPSLDEIITMMKSS